MSTHLHICAYTQTHMLAQTQACTAHIHASIFLHACVFNTDIWSVALIYWHSMVFIPLRESDPFLSSCTRFLPVFTFTGMWGQSGKGISLLGIWGSNHIFLPQGFQMTVVLQMKQKLDLVGYPSLLYPGIICSGSLQIFWLSELNQFSQSFHGVGFLALEASQML